MECAVDLVKLINTVVGQLNSLAREKNLILTFKPVAENIPMLNLDKRKIEQVLVNLIDNSIHYTHTGSVNIELSQEKKNIVIIVEDTGIGMTPEFLARIFKKFERADNAKKVRPSGTGVGLFLVKNIIDLHGGTIEVKSEENKGSKFTIRLPVS